MASDKDPSKQSPQDLDDFGQKLKKARESEETRRLWKSNVNKAPNSALGVAFRVSVELVSAVAVGFAIGWGFDQLLDTSPWSMVDTSPWSMVVFIFLGFGAGVMNVYRMAVGMNNAIGYSEKDDASQADKVEETPEEGIDRRG